MTNDQIRLHFGELNAAEMRLARAIVGWYEVRETKLRDEVLRLQSDKETLIDCANVVGMREKLEEAVKSTRIHFSPPDYTTENAKLRTAADGLAEALEQVISADTTIYWSGDESPPTKEEGDCAAIARAALAAYQATKP